MTFLKKWVRDVNQTFQIKFGKHGWKNRGRSRAIATFAHQAEKRLLSKHTWATFRDPDHKVKFAHQVESKGSPRRDLKKTSAPKTGFLNQRARKTAAESRHTTPPGALSPEKRYYQFPHSVQTKTKVIVKWNLPINVRHRHFL